MQVLNEIFAREFLTGDDFPENDEIAAISANSFTSSGDSRNCGIRFANSEFPSKMLEVVVLASFQYLFQFDQANT
jgi:hypothetical protein